MSNKTGLDEATLNQIIEDAWLNIRVNENTLFNPLEHIPLEFEEDPHMYILWLMQRPEYFSFICKEVLNVQLLPMQSVILQELWQRKFPLLIAARGGGKSWLLAVYALLRILLLPKRRVVMCGSAFRQSKIIFNYMEEIWNSAPILRDIAGQNAGTRHEPDMFRFIIGDSVAYALPIGDGQKIRGQRANDIIADEFAATSRDVFENVIAGFGVVKSGPVESVRNRASFDLSKKLGLKANLTRDISQGNQIILSGTAYYDFNHFALYWKRWKSIIKSRGNMDKLSVIFGDDEVPEDFDWKDYSIIRIPFKLLPRGLMDDAMVARSKATVHSGIYLMEYGAVFSTDSNGFFKRSLIESCVLSKDNEITLPSGPVNFTAALRGSPTKRYVYGIDPASEVDNFALVILEHYQDHRRIVYVWTINKKQHREIIKAGLSQESDFYSFCCRKIRDLMKIFPCENMAIDSQGGGVAIMEGLHDKDKMQENELPLWPIIVAGKPADSDGEPGLHIIEPINFSSSEWTSSAHHNLRKDMEDKVIIFPFFDSLSLGLAEIIDEQKGAIYDTLEDCYLNIEELKNEMSTIIMTQTLTGRDRFDVPEIKLPGNRKGRMRKDRFSALLMANYISRELVRNPEQYFQTDTGGFASRTAKGDGSKNYIGASWLANGLEGVYD